MSHAESHPRWIGAIWALAFAVFAGPSASESVVVTKANVQLANIALSAPVTRECWARYDSGGARTRGSIIEEVAFRVPCPEQMTEGFMHSLQRSLAVRGFFAGQVTGKPDVQTREAVQAFQRANGFNSPVLTLETAQKLGLVPIELQRN